ncbi:hypothetical protein JR065_07480 [Xanthomonas sp. AmX2]|uniref:hypothetical protein n=1 Tax=Xanthomonas sp. TaxID=29446 RepID=UPI00197EE3C9|nr:hypothetical protein [Xanthomonas sp.]MBN6150177.1 hypothetical protein [Xanthomonas sp.]
MKKLHALMFAGCLLGMGTPAFAETVNLANSADGANRDAGIAAVKQKLQDACKERKGTANLDSFEVVFEKTSQNPDVPKPYYVDAKLKCELP